MSRLGGRASRSARLARLSASAGGNLWRANRADRRGDDLASAEAHALVADAVLEHLGTMKGAAMKLGQMLSYMDLDLPPEARDVYRERLSKLVDAAPAADTGAVRSVIIAELGGPPEEIFAHWEDTPVAVASIGQVHRATLDDGRDVAVKVQHPGIAQAVEADLDNVAGLSRLARFANLGSDVSGLLGELRERVLAELDYQSEAAFQQAFAERYDGHPYVLVPGVHHDWCRPSILVTDFVDGRTFAEVARDATQAERDRYGEIIFRFVFGSLYRFRIFNSDPHPGNFLFPADGRVAFLDFGSARAFSTAARERLEAVHRAVEAGDTAELAGAMSTAGLLPPGSGADLDVALSWFQLLRKPMLVDEPATYTPDYARRVIAASADPASGYQTTLRQLAMPAEYLLLNRIIFGVNSLLARLEPTANWHRVMAEVSGRRDTPGSPLGEEEAPFLAASSHVA